MERERVARGVGAKTAAVTRGSGARGVATLKVMFRVEGGKVGLVPTGGLPSKARSPPPRSHRGGVWFKESSVVCTRVITTPHETEDAPATPRRPPQGPWCSLQSISSGECALFSASVDSLLAALFFCLSHTQSRGTRPSTSASRHLATRVSDNSPLYGQGAFHLRDASPGPSAHLLGDV